MPIPAGDRPTSPAGSRGGRRSVGWPSHAIVGRQPDCPFDPRRHREKPGGPSGVVCTQIGAGRLGTLALWDTAPPGAGGSADARGR
ncbi:MAG: hypothetical protein AVDCRST_MAG64-765 [uncultured Phycisphaerae bacterium]|uniref:Uncharacterized protein n=1 Tax=uncultured Phycisphaerae bacterium TaxID=904963 RepID=A0A6J4NHE0_9BACT|nr:MAG: hypothetical protein AVDCRST_MAG64-765 [uncultured Phycisphaerae bacterium]